MAIVNHCDISHFDILYKSIVTAALNGEITQEQRNANIEFIRGLCKGQLSTFERGKYENGEKKVFKVR